MEDLKGKHVLLLCPLFYGYEKEIIAKLEELGACVTFLNNTPSEQWGVFVGSLTKLHINTKWLIRSFENSILKAISGNKYDIVLVINGQRITSYTTHLIRKNNLSDGGKMVLYYWDSIDNLKDDMTRWKDFDRIYTFDNVDYEANKNSMRFLPLFYCDRYWQKEQVCPEYDIMIVGTFRLNRYNFILDLKAKNPGIKIGVYLYHSKWGVIFHKTFRAKYKHVKYDDLRYKKLSFQEVINLYAKSNSIVDIPMSGQRGLTIRTIETLAMHKKLITTNENVKKYDFYNPKDIFVMSSQTNILPCREWYDTPYSVGDDIIKQYSIENWLRKLVEYDNE